VTRHALIVVALLAVFGHTCAVPGHAHAPAATSHEGDAPAADHSRSDGGAAHVASCEAVRSGAMNVGTTLTVVAAPHAPVIHGALRSSPRLTGSSPPATSPPPLYLTHRTLRI
jgi:hypothetical protein